ncbi:CRE-CLEC-40 protein [Caenorhabditis remanei]|uniref:CRE-CLEC-40 protein n=1 Tax=Caenorhabditis remanei TaxID=31234 RepID=E3LJ81_CAERE|nr:CRE-CLEC-40 protein [Caenorhabditis remanei]
MNAKTKILERLSQVFSRETSERAGTSTPSVSTISDEFEGPEQTIVDMYDAPPKTEFEPIERQRHFGILHYTVNNRFRKMMLIGVINVILIVSFFLFIFFFVIQPKTGGGGDGFQSSTLHRGAVTTSSPPALMCTNDFVLINEKCLKLNVTAYSKPTAETICNEVGATLLSINSLKENQEVVDYLKTQNVSSVWMRLVCNNNDKSSCHWNTGDNVTYSNFTKGNPTSDAKCVSLLLSGDTTGQWKSEYCNQQLSFVCELPTTSPDNCPYNYNHHCYLRFDQSLSFSDAQSTCQKHCANLPSVHSSSENLYLTSIYGFQNQNLFLGGFASSQNCIYWIDGSPTDYINLNSFHSNFACVISHMGDGGEWETVDCSQPISSFICKRPTGTKCS